MEGSGTLSFVFLGYCVYSVDIVFNDTKIVPSPRTFFISLDLDNPTDPTKTQVILGGHTFIYNATSETYEYDTHNPSADDFDDSVEFVVNKVTSLSSESTDVQYPSAKAVYTALSGKQDTLTFDTTPTENSTNPVTSGGIYNAITENEEVVAAALNDLNDRLNNVDVEEMTSVTWAELVNLRDNNQLKPGHQYRIIDYVTKVRQVYCKSAEHPFDIIVTANSTNTLDENAKATLHENDQSMYDFSSIDGEVTIPGGRNPHLEQWEIKYCLDNDRNRFGWAESGNPYIIADLGNGKRIYRLDTENVYENIYRWDVEGYHTFGEVTDIYTQSETPSAQDSILNYDGSETEFVVSEYKSPTQGKGVIYYMKDEFGNSTPYDFKNVMFERYYDSTSHEMESNPDNYGYFYTFNVLVYNSNEELGCFDGSILLNCLYHYTDGSSHGCTDNYIGPFYNVSDGEEGVNNQVLNDIVIWTTYYGEYSEYFSNLYIDSSINIPNYYRSDDFTINDEDTRCFSLTFMPYTNFSNNTITKNSSSVLVGANNIYRAIHPLKNNLSSYYVSQTIKPNVLNVLSDPITTAKTFSLESSGPEYDSGIMNHYFWTFDTGATAPTITWPSGLTWIGGSAPTINPNKHYEISVLNNIAVWMEV